MDIVIRNMRNPFQYYDFEEQTYTLYQEKRLLRTTFRARVKRFEIQKNLLKTRYLERTVIVLSDLQRVDENELPDIRGIFRYGERFKEKRIRRHHNIEFDATLYQLDKCKSKNQQKTGRQVVYEIRNPTNIKRIK